MSDDLVKRFEHLGKAADLLKSQAAEIARLRAALATARPETELNPDRWRGAINDALTNWLDTIRDEDVPKDALRRLVAYEVTAALDPAVSQDAADLVATARREGMEEATQIVVNAKDAIPWGTVEMGCERIAAEIRAAAKEGKP